MFSHSSHRESKHKHHRAFKNSMPSGVGEVNYFADTHTHMQDNFRILNFFLFFFQYNTLQINVNKTLNNLKLKAEHHLKKLHTGLLQSVAHKLHTVFQTEVLPLSYPMSYFSPDVIYR